MIRDPIKELLKMGPFPCSDEVIQSNLVTLVDKYQQILSSIEKPVSDEEAKALTGIFGEDDFFGMCWTLVHLIETAPNWPLSDCLLNGSNEWIETLRDRANRWRDAGYPTRSFYKEAGLPDPRTGRV